MAVVNKVVYSIIDHVLAKVRVFIALLWVQDLDSCPHAMREGEGDERYSLLSLSHGDGDEDFSHEHCVFG